MPADFKPAVVHGIFQRMNTVTNSRVLEGLINEYVDQATKRRAVNPDKAQAVIPDAKSYEVMLKKKKVPQRPGIDFIPSIHPTTVHVGGFLTEFAPGIDLYNADKQPEGLKAISKEWVERTDPVRKERDKPTRAHHLLFSINEELQQRALACGLPIQDVLISSAIAAMSRWNAWAYPATSIGYLLGVHTDKPNSHIHGLVFPRDSDGNQLNLSRMAKVESRGRQFRMDYQGYLHRSYEDELVDFAKMTAPSAEVEKGADEQVRARCTIASLRDFTTAAAQFEGKSTAEQNKIIVEVSRANAEDYANPDAIRAEQAEHKIRFTEEIVPLKSDPTGLNEGLIEIAGKIRAAADALTPEIEAIRKAREAFEAGHAAYADSPLAYKLVPSSAGRLTQPNTITQEWAESLPEHRHLLTSGNPFMRELGVKEVVKTRTKQAKEFSTIANDAISSVARTSLAFEALPTRVGYYAGRAEEIRAVLDGSTPAYLATKITDQPSEAVLCSPDKGYEKLKHDVLEASHETLKRYRPFDLAMDADRDFSPIYHRGGSESDEEIEHHVPALEAKVALLHGGAAIDPEQKYQPDDLETMLDNAFANYRRTSTTNNQGGSSETPTPAMI